MKSSTKRSKLIPIFLSTFAILLLRMPATASAPSSSIAGVGKISIDAAESQAASGYVIYKFAHLTTTTGSTVDADELKATVATGNQLSQATATGHVRAFVNDVATHRKYTVTADMAVFDPKADTVDLTGNVKAVIVSPYTDGPVVQTGTSATIQLGPAPDFPKIIMRQVHAEFSVKQ
jgi:lipopolysaccharide export system protein LptA